MHIANARSNAQLGNQGNRLQLMTNSQSEQYISKSCFQSQNLTCPARVLSLQSYSNRAAVALTNALLVIPSWTSQHAVLLHKYSTFYTLSFALSNNTKDCE